MPISIVCSHGVPNKKRTLSKKMSPHQIHMVTKYHTKKSEWMCKRADSQMINEKIMNAKENAKYWCIKYSESSCDEDFEQCVIWSGIFVDLGEFYNENFNQYYEYEDF